MTFADAPSGANLFLDANLLVYHLAPHPALGPVCTQLMERIENKDLLAFTSTHVLSEAAHHLMTFEASQRFGWPSKIVERLKRQPALIQQLTNFRQAIDQVSQLGIQILTISPPLISAAAAVSQQHGLLSNDALLIALMQAHGLTNLASHDDDFDRVPGITRYAPA
jgi:predicted nucleic acid-binding protein